MTATPARPEKDRGNLLLRALDRGVGIPIVAILGFFHKRRVGPPDAISSIAVLEE